jgi:heat shock protein HslJ
MAEGSSGCNDFLGQYRAISNKLKKYVKKTSIIM